MLVGGYADVVTDLQDIESHPGNRDFERVNALICLGWKHTSSSSVVDEPSAEMDISDDNGYIWCNWVAGSLHSDMYQFHGSGQAVNSRTGSEVDVSTLAGGLEFALDALQQMVDIDRHHMKDAILNDLNDRR